MWAERVKRLRVVGKNEKTGAVVFCDDNSRPHPLAIKRVPCPDKDAKDKTMKEAEFAKDCRHPNVCEVSLYEQEQEDGMWYAYIVMRYYPKSLEADIKSRHREKERYDVGVLWEYLKTLVEVFKLLQERGIAHRDIKPANILLDDRGKLYVCDFGYAKKIDPKTARTLLGTEPYLSPLLRRALIEGREVHKLVQHDVFKSDVYSLGVTMMHLELLDLPTCFTSLKNLQSSIKELLLTVRSEELRRALDLMLTVDENGRPDFVDLYNIINRKEPFYADDSEIPVVVEDNVSDPLAVSLRCGLPYIRVSETEQEEVPCLLTLTARTQEEVSCFADLLCVVDVSGSMEGERLDTVVTALCDIIDGLSERDRVSLVTFSNDARRTCPLVTCTPHGKTDLKRCLENFFTGDLTNVIAGFNLALEILKKRRYQNNFASIILFTDGKHNVDERNPAEVFEAALRSGEVRNLSLQCFALGEETIERPQSAPSNWSVFRVRKPADIKSAFNEVLLRQKVVASDISISFKSPTDSEVPCSAVKPSSMEAPSLALAQVPVGLKYDHVFRLLTPLKPLTREARHHVISAELQYTDLEGYPVRKELKLETKCKVGASIKALPDCSVLALLQRAKAEDCLQEAKRLREVDALQQAKHTLDAGLAALGSSGVADAAAVREVAELIGAELAEIENVLLSGELRFPS